MERKAGWTLFVVATLALDLRAQVVRQRTDLRTTLTTGAALDDAGTVAFSISTANPVGTNPERLPQVFAWDLATGTARQVTSIPGGVDVDEGTNPDGVSVTDDGGKVVFLAGRRLAIVNAGGDGLRYLTPAPAGIGHFQIAGNGSRVVFDSSADLTGGNPSGIPHVFLVEADGSGLRQLTTHTSHVYGQTWPTISDDGERISYLATQGSIDGRGQIAGILRDGSGFHWITAFANLWPGWQQISGNGQSIAFQSAGWFPPHVGGCAGGSQIDLVEWNGTGLRSLDAPCDGNAAPGWAGAPDITDDAQTVFYAARNFGYHEYWKIQRDRSGRTQLTDAWLQPPPLATCDGFVRVAGGGSRFVFDCHGGSPWGGPNPDRSKELYSAQGNGTGHRQLSDTLAGDSTQPDVTADGRRVVFASSANPLAESGSPGTQIYRMASDGSDIARVTPMGTAASIQPTVSDDGTWIAFTRVERDRFDKVFTVRDDGTALVELAPGELPGHANQPHMAATGTLVVFASSADLLAEGLFSGTRIYRANRDGGGLARVSAAATDTSLDPRVDPTATWAVYARAGKIRRTRLDGSLDQQLTTLGISRQPDTTPGAALVVYVSTGNPLGSNADANWEIFLWQSATGTTRQLTVTSQASNVSPRISRDGAWVTFWSDAEFFGDPVAAGSFEPYRIEVATGRIERLGGLGSIDADGGGDEPAPAAVDGTGSVVALGWIGDGTGSNGDGNAEIFVVDRAAAPRLTISAGPAPTVVTWDVEPEPTRYDVVRGDVASLSGSGNGGVDLGAVVCVENDSLDTTTSSSPDLDTPLPGQVFFYLHRGSPGPTAGPGSYGRSSAGGERNPSSGDCAD